MRKAQPPNPHQKGGGAGGQQKMNNPQYPHQPRGVRPGGPGAGIPNNNNNANKMMNSGGAPPPRRQGIPQQQQQQNVGQSLIMNSFPTMAEMVGHQMAANDGNANRTPYSIICRTPSNPAGAAQQQQQQQQQQGNDGSGQGATNGSNAGQGPAGQQGQQVTSASPPLMQQGGGGNPQQQAPQQQQQVANPQQQQQQQQGPPHGQHSQQVAPQPHVMMGHSAHGFYVLPHMMQQQMKIPSHVPGLHPQQPQPPPNSASSGNQGSNNNVVGGSGGVGQQAGSAGGYPYMMHPERVVVAGSQHVQAGGPGGPYLPAPFPGGMGGIQGGSGSSGSNAPNSGVVNVGPFGFSLHHGSQMVLGNPQAPQGMHHHQLHSTGAAPSAPPMVMPPQQPMGMMMPGQQHPGQSLFMPQVQAAAPMQSKRERKALLITNPNTGEDVVKSMLQEQEKRDGSSTATSATSTSATATTTSTAGPTRPPGTGIVMAHPPRPTTASAGDAKRGPTGGVRITAPVGGQAPAAAAKETAGADATPTVSANLDNPDEFLPHLQKAGEAKAKEPIVTPIINATNTTAAVTTPATEAAAPAPVLSKVVEVKPEAVVEPIRKQEVAPKEPTSEKKTPTVVALTDAVAKADVQAATPVVIKESVSAPAEVLVEQPKAKTAPVAEAKSLVVEKQNAAAAKESKPAAVVEPKSEAVPEAKSTAAPKSSSSSNNSSGTSAHSNKSGAGNDQKATSSSGKKNEPAAKATAEPVSSSAAVAVDEIDRATAPAATQPSIEPAIVEPAAAKMVVPTEEVTVASLPKEEKEIINFKKEKEASAAEQEQEAAKPTKSAAADESKTQGEEAAEEPENEKEAGSEKPNAVKLVLKYDEGQWSPLNVTGRKVYSMDQMRLLQAQPISQAQPEKGIEDPFIRSNPESKKNQANSGSGNGGGGGGGGGSGGGMVGSNVLFPHFYADHLAGIQRPNNYNSKRNHSQTGSNQNESKKPQIITVSLNNDVKLNQAENAWRPSVGIKKGAANKPEVEDLRSEEEKERDSVYKDFRVILNKLTPENFSKLTEDVKALTINSEDRVNGCMQMVFEKAVIEPNYTLTYAMLCKELAIIGGEGTSHFRGTMLKHCQRHFESLSNLEETKKKRQERVAKLQAIDTGNAEKDAEALAEVKAIVEEEERRERHRSVGIVRFIGELFKQNWLQHNIISNCTEVLLRNRDEEYLECLCKLLTTVGPNIDEHPQFKSCWSSLRDIADGKDKDKKTLSSRVRFMILDLLDLRKNKWVPRRAEAKPKALSQIHKEEERAFQNNQEDIRIAQLASAGRGSMNKNQGNSGGGGGTGGGMMNMGGSRTSSQGGDNDQRAYNKNSQRGRRGNEGRDNRSSYNDRNTGSNANSTSEAANQGSNNNNDDGEWIKAPTKRAIIDPAKFKPKTQVIDDSTKLGSANSYKNWAQTKNAYATLQEMDPKDNAPQKSDNMYSRNSMERDRYEGRGSTHKSSRENSSSRMGGYDNRDRGGNSMNYNRNDRSSGGGGGGRNQPRQFMGGSSSTSSYSSSARYDDDDRSGGGKGGRGGSRGGNGGQMQPPNRMQSSGGGGKGSLHGSKSIGESRPLKMEVMDAPVRESSSIEDTDVSDQSFLDLEVTPNILMDVLKAMTDDHDKPEDHKADLAKLAQKALMAREDATAVQAVKKQVYDVMCFVMEHKEKCRQLGGQLLAYCVNNKFVSRSVFTSSLGQFFVSVEDIIIDVPKVWEYIPQFLGPAMLESQITLSEVANALELVKDSDSPTNGVDNVIIQLGAYFERIRKPEVLFDMWRRDKLSWTKFVRSYKNEDQIEEKFLVPNNLYYICNESALNELKKSHGASAAQESSPNGQKGLEETLEKLLTGDFDEDSVYDWVKANVKSTNGEFLNVLAIVIIRTTVDESLKYTIKSPTFEKKRTLLRTYLQGDATLDDQVSVLLGIQHADLKLEHPKDLLKSVFIDLFDYEVISLEAFFAWKKSPLHPEGKGVALSTLSNFFHHISDVGSDDEDSP